jgi:small subunit ribosomal protein S1
LKILKINAANHKISLGMKQLTPEPWALAAEKYKQGDRVKGKVVRISDFGAFVELEPGVDGLIHVSEMSWSKKQRKPSDIVSAGEVVEVVILSVNPGEKRVALGLKQALGDPWEETVRKYPAGSVVEGPVTSLQKFGAFVELAEGVEGMIHVGDISREKRLNHPKEVLNVGQVVKAQVLEVERTKRRFRLGMKQLEPTNADQYIAEHKPGDPVTGRVVEQSGNRAKVELGDGVFTWCTFAAEAEKPDAEAKGTGDLSSLTARLAAKWKSGAADSGAGGEGVRTGQIRSFRIVALDAAQKRVEIEPAG